MQKLRFLPLAAMTLALSLFTGCDEESDAPVINGYKLDNTAPVVTSAAASINTMGTVDFGTDKATVHYAVSGPGVSSITVPADFTVTSSGSSIGKKFDIAMGAPAGTYSISVTVTDEDGGVASQSVSFTIGGGSSSTPLGNNAGKNTATLGAQSASAGSFLNADGFEVFKSDSDVNGYKTSAQKQSIDVVFFATDAGVATFFAPTAAAAAGLGGISSWGSDAKSTIIVDAGTSPITTKEAASAAIGSQTSTQATVVSGHYYALKLSNGKYAVLNAILAGAGKSATVTVDILSE